MEVDYGCLDGDPRRNSNIFPLGAFTPKRPRQGLSYGKKRARRRKGAGAS